MRDEIQDLSKYYNAKRPSFNVEYSKYGDDGAIMVVVVTRVVARWWCIGNMVGGAIPINF